jgi:hypothetical protein
MPLWSCSQRRFGERNFADGVGHAW